MKKNKHFQNHCQNKHLTLISFAYSRACACAFICERCVYMQRLHEQWWVRVWIYTCVFGDHLLRVVWVGGCCSWQVNAKPLWIPMSLCLLFFPPLFFLYISLFEKHTVALTTEVRRYLFLSLFECNINKLQWCVEDFKSPLSGFGFFVLIFVFVFWAQCKLIFYLYSMLNAVCMLKGICNIIDLNQGRCHM